MQQEVQCEPPSWMLQMSVKVTWPKARTRPVFQNSSRRSFFSLAEKAEVSDLKTCFSVKPFWTLDLKPRRRNVFPASSFSALDPATADSCRCSRAPSDFPAWTFPFLLLCGGRLWCCCSVCLCRMDHSLRLSGLSEAFIIRKQSRLDSGQLLALAALAVFCGLCIQCNLLA